MDRIPLDGMPGVYTDVERRNMYQAQLLADPYMPADRAIAASDQQRVVDAVDAQVQHVVNAEGVSVSALICAAHWSFSHPASPPPGIGTDRHAGAQGRYAADPDLGL